MRTSKRKALAAGVGALAAGCALGGVSAGTAHASAGAARAARQQPGMVSGFAVTVGSITTDGAAFTWNRDRRATSYRVVVANASTPDASAAYDSGYTLPGTSVTVSALAPGTAYVARISAANGSRTDGWSDLVRFYTTAASGPVSTRTYPLVADADGAAENIPTGGSFTAKAKPIGQVTLDAGTYLVNLNFTATPNATASGDVFPQAFVYNGTTIAADFANDLFNIGSGALAPYNSSDANDQVNSYYSGSAVVTVPAGGETVDVYAFGYDADHGAGSYEINSATLTATELSAGAGR
jgi:hypothetical protein